MKIKRSSICSLKFSNQGKLHKLREILDEYGKVVNFFINEFWTKPPKKAELLKSIIYLSKTWLSYTARQIAAREAIDMIQAMKKIGGNKPTHRGKRMHVSSLVANLKISQNSFDYWLHLKCIGNKIIFDLPIKKHKQFNRLLEQGKRLNSYIITEKSVQFCFEIETGEKLEEGEIIGLDTGIKALASTSDEKQYGTKVEKHIERVKRCKHGSKGQKKARRALKQYIDKTAKEVVKDKKLIVFEKLKNLTKNTKVKRRLTKNMRRSLGAWNYRYWLTRLQQQCENRRSAFRTVNPAYTSQRCHACGHTERRNRNGESFLCQSCGHSDNADINAAKNILERFLTGPYGAGYKLESLSKD